jgi:hypothetical protein
LFTRILTDLERERVKEFLRENGRRGVVIRSLMSRTNKHIGKIEADLELLHKLAEKYRKTGKAGRSKVARKQRRPSVARP